MARALSEAAWQGRVVDYALLSGWWVLHFPDSRRATAAGWPDLVLVRERLVLAELKTDRGRLSAAQRDTHARLAAAGHPVAVWRPADWPAVVRLLARRAHAPCGPPGGP